MEQAVERYRRNGQVNSNGYSESPQLWPMPVMRQTSYPGQPPIQDEIYSGPEKHRNNFKVNQNSSAIMHYSKYDKGRVHEGRHAAAIAQIHQNDLHGVYMTDHTSPNKKNGVVAHKDRSQNYIKQQLSLQSKFSRAQSSRSQEQVTKKGPLGPDTELSTSFDPIKDRHLWTMWRTAVNGRIVDEVRHLEKIKSQKGIMQSAEFDPTIPGMYGKALVVPPLKRFIKFEDESESIANKMSSLGQLETSQFVYYGLPRVSVSPVRK